MASLVATAGTEASAQSVLSGSATQSDDDVILSLNDGSLSSSFRHAFIDSDDNSSTGYAPFGADFMIENDSVFRYSGSGQAWGWTLIASKGESGFASTLSGNVSAWTLPLSMLGDHDDSIVVHLEAAGQSMTLGLTLKDALASVPGPGAITGTANRTSSAITLVLNDGTLNPAFRHAFINADNRTSSGFAPYGADYMVENDRLYAHNSTSGTGWAWTEIAISGQDGFSATLSGNVSEWTLPTHVLSGLASTAVVTMEAEGETVDFTLTQDASPVDLEPPVIDPPDDAQSRVKSNYQSDDGAIFANPQRGWWRFPGSDSWPGSNPSVPEAPSVDPSTITLTYCALLLNANDSTSQLASRVSEWNSKFATVRSQGKSCITRIVYQTNSSSEWGDADFDTIRRHLAVIGPQVLTPNSDVIAVHQAGIIGAWGEWYYTDHFGDSGSVSAYEWQQRAEVLALLMDAIGPEATVAIRAPRYRRSLAASGVLSSAQIARLAFFNDCFTSSADDIGTFGDYTNGISIAQDRSDMAAWTEDVPMGGEACAPASAPASCDKVLADAELFHFSYMGIDYHRPSIASWGTGCHEELSRRLGYRLELTRTETSDSWSQSGSEVVRVSLLNTGFAAPIQDRPLQITLRSASGQYIQANTSDNTDLRNWGAGDLQSVDLQVSTSGLSAGEYSLFLGLPDAETPSDARRSIRLATPGLWNSARGLHDLGVSIRVN